MATRIVASPEKEKKLPRQEAAKRIASLVETHMTESGFSEREKNRRVAQFRKRVEASIARLAKS
jgi:hypothetical protein